MNARALLAAFARDVRSACRDLRHDIGSAGRDLGHDIASAFRDMRGVR